MSELVMEPARDAPSEAVVEFVLDGLRIVREENNTWRAHHLNLAVASALRR
jgi:hypothetical protein